MAADFPPRIPLGQTPTPLQPLKRLQDRIGGPLIWVKRDDLTGSVLSGNKVRKLEFIAAKALEEGYGALITCGGTQSNHCRATALVAAQLGLSCHLILRDDKHSRVADDKPLEMAGNRLLDSLSGAEISVHSREAYVAELDRLFDRVITQYAKEGVKALKVPTGGSDATGIWGYLAACQELENDFAANAIDPLAIVCATGSGGTQAGLTVGAEYFGLNTRVFGINVCDDEAWFINKVGRDIKDWQAAYSDFKAAQQTVDYAVNVIDGYVGQGYGRANVEVYDTIKLLASTEGIVLDPVYSAKAFLGLLKEIEHGRFNGLKEGSTDIVFIHTGGVFGLFPYANSLLETHAEEHRSNLN